MKWPVRRANCKRFTHIRPTDGIGPSTGSWSVWRAALNGAWTDSRSTLGRLKPWFSFSTSSFFWGRPRTKHLNTKHLNCHSFETFAAVKRLGPIASPQTHANVKRTGSFPDTAEEYAPDVSLQGRIPRSAGTPCNSFLLSTAPCKSSRARVRRIALSAD